MPRQLHAPPILTFSQQKKKEKAPPIPKSANVPRPNILTLTSDRIKTKTPQSDRRREWNEEKQFACLAQQWSKYAPVFELPVDLEELQRRPKNTKAEKQKAEDTVRRMKRWPSDPFSAIFTDKKGRRMICVFSSQIKVCSYSSIFPLPFLICV